jgi:hypothetical protein
MTFANVKSRLSDLWANRARYIGNERGEVKWGGGGKQRQTSTTTTQVAPLTAAQQAMYDQNIRLAQMQGQGMQDAFARQQAWEASPLFAQQQQLATLANQQIGARLGGQMLTPQEQQMLSQLYESQRTRGLEDIKTYAAQEAARRGMTVSDSPIGAPTLQSLQRFGNDLASAQAGTGLQLGQANQAFWQQIAGRANDLQQQAQQNRLALSSTPPTGFGLQNYIDQFRASTAPRTTVTTGLGSTSPQFGLGLGSIGQGIGGIGQGISAYDRYKNPSRYASQPAISFYNGMQPVNQQQFGVGGPMPTYRQPAPVNSYWGY